MEEYGLDRATTNLLYNGGLRIYATVDPDLQATMEQGMRSGGFFPRGGVQTTAACVYDEDGQRVLDENGQPVTQQVTEQTQAAMVTLDYDGRLRAVVGGLDEKRAAACSTAARTPCARWAAP